ncbi:hypothetical protein D3C76_1720370 [compost metagenome]
MIKEIIEKIIPRIPNTNKPNLDLPRFLTKRVCLPEVKYSGVLTFLLNSSMSLMVFEKSLLDSFIDKTSQY